MRNCVDSLIAGGDEVEIIIVNDGSTDDTASIADEYLQRFPRMVKVVHQTNTGHGGAINTGLQSAEGLYVKVVDSDDWVSRAALIKVIETLASFPASNRPDMVISNYVYEKRGKRHKTVIRYTRIFPKNRMLRWEDTGTFRLGEYLLMHSLIFRLDLLKECALHLPEHTFYVDNYFAYVPIEHVETLYYLDVDLYHYYIGRDEQSIQEKTMIRRIDQQLAVNKLMAEAVDLRRILSVKKRDYLIHYLEIVTTVSSVLLLLEGTQSGIEKKETLWQFIKDKDELLYDMLRKRMLGRLSHLHTRTGRGFAILIYRISRLIVGFN
jgi:glycosyltransferase involved in cell wall biosynthesis